MSFPQLTRVVLVLMGVALSAAAPATLPSRADEVDWQRARGYLERSSRGEKLNADEQAYLDRAKELRNKGQRPGVGAAGPVPAARESTGLVPLTQLKGDAKHKDQPGGLYGEGRNEPPEALLKAAAAATAKIVPLDGDGHAAADGKVVLLSIGMSNTTQEFSRFKQIADADGEKSRKLVIVDGAQGGRDAAAWSGLGGGAAQQAQSTWEEAERRIKAAGVSPNQVQIVWIKQALIQQGRFGEFPKHAEVLRDHLIAILNLAKERYPNLQVAYLSSRIYAGYAQSQLNPEPYAYEGAFSVRWVIEQEIKGDPKLNADPAKGEVKSPVVLWGPYLWADGTKGREGDDLVYKREDLAGDGTHPSDSGRQKVAGLLLKFFKTDPMAKKWFTEPAGR